MSLNPSSPSLRPLQTSRTLLPLCDPPRRKVASILRPLDPSIVQHWLGDYVERLARWALGAALGGATGGTVGAAELSAFGACLESDRLPDEALVVTEWVLEYAQALGVHTRTHTHKSLSSSNEYLSTHTHIVVVIEWVLEYAHTYIRAINIYLGRGGEMG